MTKTGPVLPRGSTSMSFTVKLRRVHPDARIVIEQAPEKMRRLKLGDRISLDAGIEGDETEVYGVWEVCKFIGHVGLELKPVPDFFDQLMAEADEI